jgi:hypothetical protein
MEIIGMKIGPEALLGQLQGKESGTSGLIVPDSARVQRPYCAPGRQRRIPVLETGATTTATRGEAAQRGVATMRFAALSAAGTRPLTNRDVHGQRLNDFGPTSKRVVVGLRPRGHSEL